MDSTVTQAENAELAGQITQQGLQRRKDQSLTGGDNAVGEENLQKDLGKEDVMRWRREIEKQYGLPEHAFNWYRVLQATVLCALGAVNKTTLR